jgi:hypothetical protein
MYISVADRSLFSIAEEFYGRGGTDLSRRVPWYDMPGLSFREYLDLAFANQISHSAVALDS